MNHYCLSISNTNGYKSNINKASYPSDFKDGGNGSGAKDTERPKVQNFCYEKTRGVGDSTLTDKIIV